MFLTLRRCGIVGKIGKTKKCPLRSKLHLIKSATYFGFNPANAGFKQLSSTLWF
jgi:hypothetical protein